jgi:hypothetical protein
VPHPEGVLGGVLLDHMMGPPSHLRTTECQQTPAIHSQMVHTNLPSTHLLGAAKARQVSAKHGQTENSRA